MGQAEGLAQGEQRGWGWGTRSDLARSASAYVHPLGPEVSSSSISPYREKEAQGAGVENGRLEWHIPRNIPTQGGSL